MKGRVLVRLRAGVLDVQGKAIAGSLASLGFAGVGDVRVGKVIEVELATDDPAEARAQLVAMAEQLLANPVMEDFDVSVLP